MCHFNWTCSSNREPYLQQNISLKFQVKILHSFAKMTAVTTTKESADKYREILIQNGITDEIKEIQTISPNTAGDSFASRCECVTIYFQDEKLAPIELFVKKTVTNNDYAGMLRDMELFETEEAFFNTIFADMKKYSKEKNGFDLEGLLPKCYYADKNLVVLENLVKRGFAMLDKLDRHTFEQSSLVLINLAKLHGTSYVFVKELGEEAFLEKYPSMVDAHMWSEAGESINGPFLKSTFEATTKILQAHPTPGSEKALEHVLGFGTDGFSKIAKYFDLKNPSCAKVICHGDLWGPNFLFKANEETKEYDECVIIDLQTAHLGSPALDLVYYLFYAVDSVVRRKHWKNLLKVYYDTFSATVERLEGVLEFSFQDLINEYRKNSEPGYFLGLFFVFGVKAFEKIPHLENIEGNVMEKIMEVLYEMVEKSIDEEGRDLSIGVVEAYQEFQSVVNGRD